MCCEQFPREVKFKRKRRNIHSASIMSFFSFIDGIMGHYIGPQMINQEALLMFKAMIKYIGNFKIQRHDIPRS